MKKLHEYPKEVQNIIISAYFVGKEDGCVGNNKPKEQILEYLQDIINPQEENCHITLIDSVS